MRYNTEEKPIRMREYGRYVQDIVDNICKEPDRRRRQVMAEKIYNVMMRLSAEKGNSREKRTKVWNHLAKMTGYTLDIDYPVEIVRK